MKRYWVAINGASAALSEIPFEEVRVMPRPRFLIGFPTLTEAKRAQNEFLHAPIDEAERFLAHCFAGHFVDVIARSFPNPEPPTEGSTLWLEEPA